MPLIECVDCNHQISDAAPACPHCGRPGPMQDQNAAPSLPQGIEHSMRCAVCQQIDRVQVASEVFKEDAAKSATVGTLDLDGVISTQTTEHGRFQTQWGTGWIRATEGFRKGSMTKGTLSLSGSTASEGSSATGLLAEWLAMIPAPEPTAAYADGLAKFKVLPYCRRCGVFTHSNQRSLDLHDTILESFGSSVILRQSINSAAAEVSREIVDSNFSLQHVLGVTSQSFPIRPTDDAFAAINGGTMAYLAERNPLAESWEFQLASETHLVESNTYTDRRRMSGSRKWTTAVVYRCASTTPSPIAGVVVSAGLWKNRIAPTNQSTVEALAQTRMLKVFNQLQDRSADYLPTD